jgi:hypothetical protein
VLRVEERSRDGGTHWADVVSLETGGVIAASYGAGTTEAEAKARAVRRWRVEQEPPPPLPRRLP